MGEFPGSIDYFVDQSRVFVGQNTHSAIVLHGTGGNPDQTARQLGDYFRTNDGGVSSTYGIDRAGIICQYVREQDGAAANCCLEAGHDPFWDQFNGDNLNIHTISIEHENDSANSLPLTQVQQDASFKLVAYLCNKYHLSFDHVKTHASIAPLSRTRCPGNYPLDQLKAFLNGGNNNDMATDMNDPVMQQYFHMDGDRLVRNDRTDISLFGGIKGLYLQFGGVALCGLPLSGEQYLPQYPGTAYVICERLIIVYDPLRKIDRPPVPATWSGYLMHIDEGIGQQILGIQSSPQQSQINTLQNKLKQIATIIQS
jgi:hypothetical protein